MNQKDSSYYLQNLQEYRFDCRSTCWCSISYTSRRSAFLEKGALLSCTRMIPMTFLSSILGIDMSSFHHACFRNSNPQSGNGILAGFRLQPSARFSALAAYADSFDAPQDVRYFLFCRGQRVERLIVSKKKRSDSALIVLVVSSVAHVPFTLYFCLCLQALLFCFQGQKFEDT